MPGYIYAIAGENTHAWEISKLTVDLAVYPALCGFISADLPILPVGFSQHVVFELAGRACLGCALHIRSRELTATLVRLAAGGGA